MNIYLELSHNLTIINDYLEFNQVPFTNISIQNNVHSLDQFHNQSNNLLIVNSNTFKLLITNANTKDVVVNFCQNNHLWVWNDIDGLIFTLQNLDIIADLDKKINSNSITLFHDGEIDHKIKSSNLLNIKCLQFPQNSFIKFPRIKNAILTKNLNAKDFLLTMIVRSTRPHRPILQNELLKNKDLASRGHVIMHNVHNVRVIPTDKYLSWVGEVPQRHKWYDGFPSMDLYRDSLIELIPETLCDSGHFITEKTIKAIATKTPFLMISSPGYLAYLKKLGFKTFGDIIDESYDLEEDLTLRIKLVVDLLDNIIKNNARDFYHKCLPILEHNQRVLFEMSGSWQYHMDNFIKTHLPAHG